MKRKYALYPIIMSACAILCFIAVVIVFAGVVQPLWGRMLLLILPALILGIVAFFAVKGKLGVSATTIWTTILSIILLLASVFYVLLLGIWTATTTTTDVQYYGRAYAQIDDVDAVEEIFPKTIPADAENIIFTYTPQFLQGGEVFELSYTTTNEKLTEWTALLNKEAEWIGLNSEWYTENNWSFDGVEAIRYQLDWDGGFNHGEMCYVLIDDAIGRITFFIRFGDGIISVQSKQGGQ